MKNQTRSLEFKINKEIVESVTGRALVFEPTHEFRPFERTDNPILVRLTGGLSKCLVVNQVLTECVDSEDNIHLAYPGELTKLIIGSVGYRMRSDILH